MSRVKQIIRLRKNGTSLRSIAHAVGASRNTVKKYLRLIEIKGYSNDELLNEEDERLEALLADPDQASSTRFQSLQRMFPYIEKELKRTGVTRWILWGEYKEKHTDGYSYSQFCEHLQRWMETRSATMHFDHDPGDQMYIDYAGKKLQIVDPSTGELTDVEVYVAVLGYSQLTYLQAVASQKKEDFISATEKALHYFGGVPRVLIPDNLKSAVQKANKYEATLNADFADFANHYNTSVLPARSRKPRDKSLVEGAVKIAYSRIYAPLRNEVFTSIASLNERIKQLLESHNQVPFQGSEQSRRDRFEQTEKKALQALPPHHYELKKYKRVTVMKNSHVHLSEDKHYYSVPYRYIGRKVKLIYTSHDISIFYNKERVGWHKRTIRRFGYTTVKDHLPSTHQFVADWNPDKFVQWAANIHPQVKDYITHILESKVYPEQAYRSCVGILSQEKKVGRDRLIKAVQRAITFQAYNYKTIEKILKGGLDRLHDQEMESIQVELPFHDNIRGPEQYQ